MQKFLAHRAMAIPLKQFEKSILLATLMFSILSAQTGKTSTPAKPDKPLYAGIISAKSSVKGVDNSTTMTNRWNILSEIQGTVTSMSMSVFGRNAYFDIEKEIIFTIDKDGNPVRGEIKLVNGQERELQQQEAVSYWDEFDGAHALWDYLLSKDRIVSIDPKTAEIPNEAFGKQSRLITGNGKEYFGKINAIFSNPAWFTIEIPGWSLYVYKQNVHAIQQMK